MEKTTQIKTFCEVIEKKKSELITKKRGVDLWCFGTVLFIGILYFITSM
jgi:hypothetical protein